MIRLTDHGVFISKDGQLMDCSPEKKYILQKNSMAWQILSAHNTVEDMENLKLKFDALVSPDNNYVSILQTAAASGVKKFPVPYVLSNCHNTLCAVGGTINEDDHMFGLDNVKKYGGIYLPPYKAVCHEYMREMMAGCGKMILGSDSHTRYGAIGTMGIGEGGGEIAKQLLSQTYDVKRPSIIAVKLTGNPRPGVGPQDVALTLIGATFNNNFNKNKILEFIGEGVHNLSMEFRMGIDVMTTESAALSSIWETDEKTRKYLETFGREEEYKPLAPLGDTYYDGLIEIDLDKVECMMALPYHPSNVISINEFRKNPEKYLKEVEAVGRSIKGNKGKTYNLMDKLEEDGLHIDQALVSGCSGGLFENIAAMSDILRGVSVKGGTPALGIGPASQPIFAALMKDGIASDLTDAGATLRPCICGPCFGVTDVPADNQLSIRHVTRNYPNREGSKPGNGQMAASILMDARSIAATIRNGGILAAATDFDVDYQEYEFTYNTDYYKEQVLNCYNKGDLSVECRKGPNIEDWPVFYPMKKHLLLQVAGAYTGSVTTDDLSPSGDAVAYRSNPPKLAEFTMINRDTSYVTRSKEVKQAEDERRNGQEIENDIIRNALSKACEVLDCSEEEITIGSMIVSNQIGDGSSREQAASSQKILGGVANIANEYATKRYRSNLINWGMLPIVSEDISRLENGMFFLVKNVPELVEKAGYEFDITELDSNLSIVGNMGTMTEDEKAILLSGCLINYNKNLQKA